MTDKLTPEQRKRVAEAVGANPDVWLPDNFSEHWKALVTWLAKQNIELDGPINDADIIDAIASGDTDRLESMVLEILEAQDD